jgi:cytochrome c553
MKKAISLPAAAWAALFALVGALAPAQAQDVKASLPDGEKKVAMCVGCHGIPGYQASFPEVHKVPMISGQGGQYITAALNAYKKGERKHPTMRGIAASLTDQDIADVSAYYAASGKTDAVPPEQPAVQPSPEVAALLTKGACVSCHGVNYSKPIDGSYPKLAGQFADYLFVALKSYKTEGNPHVGRGNAIMGGQVKQFSNAELKAMAKYMATLPGDLKTVKESPFIAH